MRYQRTHNTVEAVLFTGELTDEVSSFLNSNGWKFKYVRSGRYISILCDGGHEILYLAPNKYLVLLEDGSLKIYPEHVFKDLFREYASPVLFPDNPDLAPLPMSDHDE